MRPQNHERAAKMGLQGGQGAASQLPHGSGRSDPAPLDPTIHQIRVEVGAMCSLAKIRSGCLAGAQFYPPKTSGDARRGW